MNLSKDLAKSITGNILDGWFPITIRFFKRKTVTNKPSWFSTIEMNGEFALDSLERQKWYEWKLSLGISKFWDVPTHHLPPQRTKGIQNLFIWNIKWLKEKKALLHSFAHQAYYLTFFFVENLQYLLFFLEIWRRETRKVINIQKDLLSTNKHMGASIFLFHLSINAELVVMKRKIFRSFFWNLWNKIL